MFVFCVVGVADVLIFEMNASSNLMTGNTVKYGSSLARMRWSDAWNFSSVIFCYALGSFLYRALVHLQHHQSTRRTSARFLASPLILTAFGGSDLVFHTNKFFRHHFKHILPLALGFGLLNAATTDALGGTMTNAYTGHIVKVSQGVSDWLFAADPRQRTFLSATLLSAQMLVCFLVGIILGASAMPSMTAAQESYNLPLFTVYGTCCVTLLQLYDRPFPQGVTNIKKIMAEGRPSTTKVDVATLWLR